MSTITFDTHKFVKDLESAGVPPLQALDSTLATRSDLLAMEKTLRADIEHVDRKLIEFDGEFKAVKWMLGIIVGGVVMLVLRAFFPV